jgi:hypothetical protein
MKMIPHQAKGVNLPTGLGARLAQRGDKPLAVLVIPEDLRAPVAPIHY